MRKSWIPNSIYQLIRLRLEDRVILSRRGLGYIEPVKWSIFSAVYNFGLGLRVVDFIHLVQLSQGFSTFSGLVWGLFIMVLAIFRDLIHRFGWPALSDYLRVSAAVEYTQEINKRLSSMAIGAFEKTHNFVGSFSATLSSRTDSPSFFLKGCASRCLSVLHSTSSTSC